MSVRPAKTWQGSRSQHADGLDTKCSWCKWGVSRRISSRYRGSGAYEIRVQDEAGAFRVIYVAKFEHAVYVLHAFQKKTRKTPQADIELAAKRYKLIREEP